MSNWYAYERKRGALERKWLPKVKRVLDSTIVLYIDELKKGRSSVDFFNYTHVYGVIANIYKEAGTKFAGVTIREISPMMPKRKFLGLQVSHRKSKRGDVFTPAPSLKSDKFTEDVIRALQISGLDLAQRITDTTKKEVLAILTQGQKEGWGIEKIASEIVKQTGLTNRNRARTIARTEIGRAAGVGKILAAKSFEVAMDKVWIGAADERERKTHWEMNDKAVDLDDKFYVGGQPMLAPGDPNGGAKETINCRCTLVFRIKKDPQGNIIPRHYYTPTNYTLPTSGRLALSQIAEQIATGVSLGVMIRNAIDNGETN